MLCYGCLVVFVDLSLESENIREHMNMASEMTTNTGRNCQHSVNVDSFTTLQFREKISKIAENSQTAEHELCTECTTILVELLTVKLKESFNNLDDCSNFVASWEARNQNYEEDEDLESLIKMFNETTQEEQSLLTRLKDVRQEYVQVKNEIDCAKLEQLELNNTVKMYYESEAEQKGRQLEAIAEYESLKCTLERYERHSAKIRRNHLLLNVFVIVTSKQIAVINGCRIGCLPEEFVKWSEINFGIGQLCLSVTAVSNFLEYKFTAYKIVPMAGQSYIIKLDSANENTHLLYSNSFDEKSSKFDLGMSALLQCIEQLYQEIKRLDNDFRLPFLMKTSSIINDIGQEYSMK